MGERYYDYEGFREEINENWQKFYHLACSYEKAILILLNHEKISNSFYSERDILPILNNLHNYIELIFKALLLEKKQELKIIHNIKLLFFEVKKYHNFNLNKNDEEFINFLNSLGENGYFFRYPIDKNKIDYHPEPTLTKPKTLKLLSIDNSIRSIFLYTNNYFRNNLGINWNSSDLVTL